MEKPRKTFREAIPPLALGAKRERAGQLVSKLLTQGLTSEEKTELATTSAQLMAHKQRLGQTERPAMVGEFRESLTGRVVLATFEGVGNIGLKYADENPDKVRIRTVDDLEVMRKDGYLVPIVQDDWKWTEEDY